MRAAGFGLRQRLRPEDMTDRVTAEEDLFRVWHLGIPEVATDRWEISIEGLVARPRTVDLADLRQLRQHRVTSVHECAGNPLRTTVPQRRVGAVQWGGALLADVLDLAGPGPAARFVISSGCDHGTFAGAHHDRYEKDLPLTALDSSEVLVATHINGRPMPVERGGPVRLVVPGYYGTNSTKWLTRLALSTDRSPSAFTTTFYMDPPTEQGGPRRPVWALAPNSVIVAPVDGQVHAGVRTEVWGWAWAAEPVTAVDISIDGGHTWDTATVEDRTQRSWQRFSHAWTPASVGEHILVSRAATARGAVQPDAPLRNRQFRRLIFVTLESA